MIIVSGTRRSGTSMWMQVLAAAGLPIIGDRFPLDWHAALGSINPDGFFESTLRDGIHHATNPDPRSGQYLHPDDTRMHAVKVFAEGLVRSDLAFLDRVLVTIRPWRCYAASMEKLLRTENAARGWTDADRPPRLPAALEWWTANYAIVRDIAMRRYRVHLQPYPEVLANPSAIVPRVLAWIGDAAGVAQALDVDAAIRAVHAREPEAADDAMPDPDPDPDLPAADLAVFDALYEALVGGRGLPTALLARMNDVHERVAPAVSAHATALMRWLAARATSGGAPPEPLALTGPVRPEEAPQ